MNKPSVESIFNQSSLENIEKLKKIDKLREELRYFNRSNYWKFDDKTQQNYVDITDLMSQFGEKIGVFIEYRVQQIQDCSYSGVLYLDKYKITNSVHKKKKKCKLNTYIEAFNLLISSCTLAVRSIQNIGESIVEYELYNIDGYIVLREQTQIRLDIVKSSSSSTDNNSKTNNKHQM